MQSNHKNTVVLASAGSRKTTLLVEAALSADADENVLIVTYTNDNLDEIRQSITSRNGVIPTNVTVQSWFSFLLQDGARPYLSMMTNRRAESVNFITQPNRFIPKTDIDNYYFDAGSNIYEKRLSDFVVACDEKAGGLVVDRLEKIYDLMLIDEVQDLNGYDLDLLELLFSSKIKITAVGDPRQWTYSTNTAMKHKNYKGIGIVDWFMQKEKGGLCSIVGHNECYRCNQTICDYADLLYPKLPKTKSKVASGDGHEGVFAVTPKNLKIYCEAFKPQVLRHNINSNTYGHPAINFGNAKGRTYEHVLIVPTADMKSYLESKDPDHLADVTKSKLYVAITRARKSVAFLYNGKKQLDIPLFENGCSASMH